MKKAISPGQFPNSELLRVVDQNPFATASCDSEPTGLSHLKFLLPSTTLVAGVTPMAVNVTLGGQTPTARSEVKEGGLRGLYEDRITLKAGQSLEIGVTRA